jgi:hypothetical protein
MSNLVNVPYFPVAPKVYSPGYTNEVVRSFSVYLEQLKVPGPQFATSITLNPQGQIIGAGELSYNTAEDTVDLTHLNGVVQQIGFETYMRVANDTGSTIPNGTVVGFAGVNGEIKVSPYIADGTVPELYFVGVTTFDMEDGVAGPVTLYGKVRGLDTTGTDVGETWAVGDILYASATTAGAFTKVRPTAPNAVISVAAVLSVSSTEGVIMVRPTIPIGLDYGTFSDTTDQTLAAINTATPVKLNTTDISNGVTIVNDGSGNPTRITVSQSGFYQVSVSNQYTSSNSSSKNIQTWLRKNGTNIPDSNSYVTLSANGENTVFSSTYGVSLSANDYVQVMWASDDTAVSINSIAATGYSPAAPSAIVTVTQIQL